MSNDCFNYRKKNAQVSGIFNLQEITIPLPVKSRVFKALRWEMLNILLKYIR